MGPSARAYIYIYDSLPTDVLRLINCPLRTRDAEAWLQSAPPCQTSFIALRRRYVGSFVASFLGSLSGSGTSTSYLAAPVFEATCPLSVGVAPGATACDTASRPCPVPCFCTCAARARSSMQHSTHCAILRGCDLISSRAPRACAWVTVRCVANLGQGGHWLLIRNLECPGKQLMRRPVLPTVSAPCDIFPVLDTGKWEIAKGTRRHAFYM